MNVENLKILHNALPRYLQNIVISYCDFHHFNEYVKMIQEHEYQEHSTHSTRIQCYHDMIQEFGWTSIKKWKKEFNYTSVAFQTYGYAIMRNVFNDLLPRTLDWLVFSQHLKMLMRIVTDNQFFWPSKQKSHYKLPDYFPRNMTQVQFHHVISNLFKHCFHPKNDDHVKAYLFNITSSFSMFITWLCRRGFFDEAKEFLTRYSKENQYYYYFNPWQTPIFQISARQGNQEIFEWWMNMYGQHLTRTIVQKCINLAEKNWGGNYSKSRSFIVYLRNLKKKLQIADGFVKRPPTIRKGHEREKKKSSENCEQKTQEMV